MTLTSFGALAALYGTDEFTTDEVRRATNSPRIARTLSELKRRGLLARLGRARYRVLSPGEGPDLRAIEHRRVWEVVRALPCRFAWAGPTAVEVWTNGRYFAGPSMTLRELHVNVERKDFERAAHHLRRNRVSASLRKRVGTVVRLHPVSFLRPVFKFNEPVIARGAVDEYLRKHPSVFEGAKPWMDDRSD